MAHTVCFTGHRPNKIADVSLVQASLEKAIASAIATGYTNFIVGGALGVDTWAALAVIRARKSHPHIRLFVAVPFRGFTSRWSPFSRSQFAQIIRCCDGFRVCSDSPSKSAYHVRNRFMVDSSDLVIACWNGDSSGGTASTVRYAHSQGIPIINCYPD